MKQRRNALSLIIIVVLAFGSLIATFVVDNKPALGLDLQGGISLVLAPSKKVDSGILKQSIAIIRNRVDALGVAEPEITQQGQNIIVQLPGVKDQEKARRIIGQTAQLRFRLVLNGNIPPEDYVPPTTTTTTIKKTKAQIAAAKKAGASTSTTDSTTTTSTTIKPDAIPTTTQQDDALHPDNPVILPQLNRDGSQLRRLELGPRLLDGSVIKTARAAFSQQDGSWYVQLQLTGTGSQKFDGMAAANVQKQIAIVLDGVVESAPTINATSFQGKPTITGSFTQKEAKDLALVLRYGSLPITLQEQNVQKVSATLGKDSLNAGIVAGAVGLGLVLLYMIAYYRALGVVVIIGLTVSASLLWSIISYLGTHSGLALSLAGATGIIVSIGVTVDSYVVFFERLKDEIRSGKTVRSSVDRGFTKAYRTILAADISSLIAAGFLYVLTVGPVRGFAFFLGLSTLLDLFVAYFFTRPIVAILARSRTFTEAPGLGVARGLAAAPAPGGAS